MILERLSEANGLTPTERKISAVVMQYPQYVINLSLRELAEKSYASEASVIRLCKKVGTRGFAEFKIRLARELDSFSGEGRAVSVNIPIHADDDADSVVQTMYELSVQSLRSVRRELDINMLKRAMNLLRQSDLVHIYGRGESLVLAEDFHYKLLRIGVRSSLNSENGFQEVESLEDAPRGRIRECALVISQYCDSHHVNYLIDELTECHVPFILITSSTKAWPYDRYAYVTLRFPNAEGRHKMGSFAFRTAALFLLDCLFGCLFASDYDTRSRQLARSSQRKARREYFYRPSSQVSPNPHAYA